MFKEGQVVIVTGTRDEMYRDNRYDGNKNKGDVGIIDKVSFRGSIRLEGDSLHHGWISAKFLEPMKTGKPHKHASLIKAWADGAPIQINEGEWRDQAFPSWREDRDYRIKPAVSDLKVKALKELAELEARTAELRASVEEMD